MSTTTDEEIAQFKADLESAQANRVTQLINDPGEPPKMPMPGDARVRLHLGVNRNGEYFKDAVVREMIGYDEEKLAAVAVTGSLTAQVDALVQLCTVTVGGQPMTDDEFANLLIGDRDELFLRIVRTTFGAKKNWEMECGSCREKSHVVFDLDEDIKRSESPVPLALRVNVTIPSGAVAVCSPVTVKAAARLFGGEELTVPEMTSIVIETCVLSLDDRPMDAVVARRLSVRDRRYLVEKVMELEAGPVFGQHSVECPACHEPIWFAVLGGDLLSG